MTVRTVSNSKYNFDDSSNSPEFRVGDRVRFANGPIMHIVEHHGVDEVLCYWWNGPMLQEGVFPTKLLIHVMTPPGEPEVTFIGVIGEALEEGEE